MHKHPDPDLPTRPLSGAVRAEEPSAHHKREVHLYLASDLGRDPGTLWFALYKRGSLDPMDFAGQAFNKPMLAKLSEQGLREAAPVLVTSTLGSDACRFLLFPE